jgi:hypothetical protein
MSSISKLNSNLFPSSLTYAKKLPFASVDTGGTSSAPLKRAENILILIPPLDMSVQVMIKEDLVLVRLTIINKINM